MRTTRITACLVLLCLAEVSARHGGDAGGTTTGSDDQQSQKVQNSLLNAHTFIAKAAEAGANRGSTYQATSVAQMLAAASADDSVSHGTMQTLVGVASEGARKILNFVRGEDDRLHATSYEVSAAIINAANAGDVATATSATRTGRDMGIIATAPTTYFHVDHVKDMGASRTPPKRMLRGTDGRPMETLWASQDTSQAIKELGSTGTRWGSINAGAASGFRGNSVLTERLGGVYTNPVVDGPDGGGRRLKAFL